MFELLRAGFTEAYVQRVIRYSQREIRDPSRSRIVDTLKLSNVLQLDRFEEDFNSAASPRRPNPAKLRPQWRPNRPRKERTGPLTWPANARSFRAATAADPSPGQSATAPSLKPATVSRSNLRADHQPLLAIGPTAYAFHTKAQFCGIAQAHPRRSPTTYPHNNPQLFTRLHDERAALTPSGAGPAPALQHLAAFEPQSIENGPGEKRNAQARGL